MQSWTQVSGPHSDNDVTVTSLRGATFPANPTDTVQTSPRFGGKSSLRLSRFPTSRQGQEFLFPEVKVLEDLTFLCNANRRLSRLCSVLSNSTGHLPHGVLK